MISMVIRRDRPATHIDEAAYKRGLATAKDAAIDAQIEEIRSLGKNELRARWQAMFLRKAGQKIEKSKNRKVQAACSCTARLATALTEPARNRSGDGHVKTHYSPRP